MTESGNTEENLARPGPMEGGPQFETAWLASDGAGATRSHPGLDSDSGPRALGQGTVIVLRTIALRHRFVGDRNGLRLERISLGVIFESDAAARRGPDAVRGADTTAPAPARRPGREVRHDR